MIKIVRLHRTHQTHPKCTPAFDKNIILQSPVVQTTLRLTVEMAVSKWACSMWATAVIFASTARRGTSKDFK